MASKLVYLDGFKPSDEQRRELTVLAESLPDVLAIQVYPTLEIVGDQVSGIVMVFPPEATVDATIVPERLWETTALSRIHKGYRGAQPSDEHFAGKNAAIQASVLQTPPPANMRAAIGMRDAKTGKDLRPWRAEMGGSGAFAGAFYVPVGEDHRERHYYLAVRGTVPQLVQDLKESIARDVPTYADLVQKEPWRSRLAHGQYVADRNAQRNLVSVAAACQVSLPRMEDIGSKLTSPDHAPPERAIPDYQQTSYSIGATRHAGKPAVAVYCGVCPAAIRPCGADGRTFVAANPNHGIYMFSLSAGRSAAGGGIPSALPSSHKTAAAVKPAMKNAGWNPEHHVGLLVPLALVETK